MAATDENMALALRAWQAASARKLAWRHQARWQAKMALAKLWRDASSANNVKHQQHQATEHGIIAHGAAVAWHRAARQRGGDDKQRKKQTMKTAAKISSKAQN
jgi:hypothetical protein